MTMGHVFEPLSLVNIAAYMLEFALAPSLVVCPLALISSTIGPLLHAEPVP
eukprot:CAMPEP_0172726880 /NCGR_PEP_ID=MMETSP1074-20121228/91365_1 /TAXON_ID=2916 /ORGANISM="Ceratium fusus, Strain PA161109" /LENGTH=50 /DNA_ID=CAMNT_0013553981 /DNA_START=471 /DNA_END=623 /DNA_ORIENTATION=+